MIDLKEPWISIEAAEDRIDVAAVCVGDEYLSETRAGADHLQYMLHPRGIELVEYVVKKQDRCFPAGYFQVIEYCQPQGEGE